MSVHIHLYRERFILKRLGDTIMSAKQVQNLQGNLAGWRLREEFQCKPKAVIDKIPSKLMQVTACLLMPFSG